VLSWGYITADTYLVKVIDEQKSTMSDPKPLILIDQFHVTRSDYFEHYGIHVAQQAITFNLPPHLKIIFCFIASDTETSTNSTRPQKAAFRKRSHYRYTYLVVF
jgi:hypothetical protein